MKPSTQLVFDMLTKAGKPGVCASAFLDRGIGRAGARIWEIRHDHDFIVSMKVCKEHRHPFGPVFRYTLEGPRVKPVTAEQLQIEVAP